jgi:DNA-binding NarL/FixJ family response regulator
MANDLPLPRPPIRLAIVEDEGLLRDLLANRLGSLDGIEVIGTFENAAAAEAALPALAPHVVLLDILLGKGKNGVDLGIALRRQLPDLGIVLLSSERDPAYLTAVPAACGNGWSYLHKASVTDVRALERAVRGAAEGMVVLDAGLASQLVGGRAAISELSDRARSVLELVAQGYSNASIAERLCLAEKSVENVLRQLYRQLGIETSDPGVHARVQATLHYMRQR